MNAVLMSPIGSVLPLWPLVALWVVCVLALVLASKAASWPRLGVVVTLLACAYVVIFWDCKGLFDWLCWL